ncbi:DUF397 domain-containing protein [Saccharopolyspora sp. 5N708]|uniref:DUF397 domain-containing protein n=1 Tax=Saccharopolyspora sp. 5N708 TaxID=3457424 RepID=UPI003FD2CED3
MTEPNWRKSTYSDKYNCVEVALTPEATAVRDSKNPCGDILNFNEQPWHTFLSAVKGGRYQR